MGDEQRLLVLLAYACEFGDSLDELELSSRGLDTQAVLKLCGSVSALPRKRKSRDVP
ncbi:hypothetical protein SAMN04515695_2208 [Pseudovibrio sp. Tun.PSC04-5.I4]|nr:hypothetical protein SAMN04515695_2208 [Pseudovibrio sp. Tun.PSC04-5.I4]